MDTPWSRADELLAATCDERYQAVSTSTERKALFDEFLDALREKDASEKRQTTEKAREAFRKALVQLAREHPAASHEDDDAALLIGVFGRTRFSDVESAMQKKNPNLLLSLPVWKSTGVASMAWRSTRRFSTTLAARLPKHNAIDAVTLRTGRRTTGGGSTSASWTTATRRCGGATIPRGGLLWMRR